MATGRIPINGTAAIQSTIVDAKGDLIAGTGADAVSRLAVGANGTTLVADSSEATGLKWDTPAASIPANAAATVATSQGTSSTTYTDLTTVGPSVTVTTGTKALVIVTGDLSQDSDSFSAFMSYAVSGASTVSASDATGLRNRRQNNTGNIRVSAASVVTLTAGSNTFTAKYRADNGIATFVNRAIFVMNLA